MVQTTAYALMGKSLDWSGSHIERLKVRLDYGNTLGGFVEIWQRNQVVAFIDDGYKFTTFFPVDVDRWMRGAEVHDVTINGQKYLRTDGNRIAADNLGNLPDF